jgi:hypothetical protein
MWALGVAAALSFALAVAVLALYSAQQAPWALAVVMLAFPFIFMLAWLIINAWVWWNDAIGGKERSDISGERRRDNESV